MHCIASCCVYVCKICCPQCLSDDEISQGSVSDRESISDPQMMSRGRLDQPRSQEQSILRRNIVRRIEQNTNQPGPQGRHQNAALASVFVGSGDRAPAGRRVRISDEPPSVRIIPSASDEEEGKDVPKGYFGEGSSQNREEIGQDRKEKDNTLCIDALRFVKEIGGRDPVHGPERKGGPLSPPMYITAAPSASREASTARPEQKLQRHDTGADDSVYGVKVPKDFWEQGSARSAAEENAERAEKLTFAAEIAKQNKLADVVTVETILNKKYDLTRPRKKMVLMSGATAIFAASHKAGPGQPKKYGAEKRPYFYDSPYKGRATGTGWQDLPGAEVKIPKVRPSDLGRSTTFSAMDAGRREAELSQNHSKLAEISKTLEKEEKKKTQNVRFIDPIEKDPDCSQYWCRRPL